MYPLRYILILLIFTGCSSCKSETVHSFQVYEKNGITIAETIGGPKFEGEIFKYIEVLKINQDERLPESLLVLPNSAVLMDENGSFYVEDHRPTRIVCFDSDGNYSHNIGRVGQGPGEYQRATITDVSGDVVSVWDSQLGRLSLFQTDGTFMESHYILRQSMTRSGEFRLEVPHRGPDNKLVLIGRRRTSASVAEATTLWNSAAVMILSSEADTLALLSTERVRQGTMLRNTGLNYIYFNASPSAVYHSDHGVLMTTGHEPRIDIFGLDGQLHRIIKVDIPLNPVMASEKRKVLTHLRQRVREAEDARRLASAKAALDHLEFCDPKAYWNDILIDEYGYIWARRPGDRFWITQGELVNPIYRLFSPEGEYLGDTQLPADLGTITRGHHIAIQIEEETGEFDIVIYRMQSNVDEFHYPN